MLVQEIIKAMGFMGFDTTCINIFKDDVEDLKRDDLYLEVSELRSYFIKKIEQFGLIIKGSFIVEILEYTIDPIHWLADVIYYLLPHLHVNQYVYFKV